MSDFAADILARYAAGERSFEDLDYDPGSQWGTDPGPSFDGAMLEDADFSRSYLFYSSFRNARLRGVSFRDGNVKCCDFDGADLTNADFRGASVEATSFIGATLDGASFAGAGYYGIDLPEDFIPES